MPAPKKVSMRWRLQNAIDRPNAWIVAQGYLWVKEYLHTPALFLKKSMMECQKVKQLSMLYDACSILSDVNYILGSYKTAYRWRSLGYQIDSSTDEIVEDLIDIAQLSGMTKNLGVYIKQYLAHSPDHKKSDLRLDADAADKNVLSLLDKLNRYHPKEVIKAITDEDDATLRFIKTLAYGAAQDIDVFMKRIQSHVEAGKEIKSQDLYYFPLDVLDSSDFWNLIIKYKAQICTDTVDFDLITSNHKSPDEVDPRYLREYQEMPPFLHLARTDQDIEKMKSLAQQYPLWKDPALCVRFFESCGMMPRWKEFYCLEDFNPKNFLFLPHQRPVRFRKY